MIATHARSKRLFSLAIALAIVATVAVFATSEARAVGTGTVSGLIEIREAGVTDPYAGVTVQVKSGATVVASTTTASDGAYSTTVEPGTYTVVATPPAASGLTPITEPGIVVTAGASTPVRFLFDVIGTRVPVTGTVTDGAGTPVPGVEVTLYTVGTGSVSGDGGTATSGADGTYRIDVRQKDGYRMFAEAGGLAGLPDEYVVSLVGTRSFSAATTIDIPLPRSSVTFRVEDVRGTVLANASVGVPQAIVDGPPLDGMATTLTVSTSGAWTDASGRVSVLLPDGRFTANGAPGSNLGLLGGSTIFSMPATGDVVIVLDDKPDPGKTRITAQLLHADGTPLAGAKFLMLAGGTGTANALGEINFESNTVTDRLQVRGPHPKLPGDLMITTVDAIELVNGGLLAVGDVTVPTVTTTLRILDPDGTPIEGATLEFFLAPDVTGLNIGPYPASGVARYRDGAVRSDADGYITMQLLGDSTDIYQATVRAPRCGSGVAYKMGTKSVRFGAGTTDTVDMTGEPCPPPIPDPVAVSGRIMYNGIGSDGFDISVRGTVFKQGGSSTDDTFDGYFTIEDGLPPDAYRLTGLDGDLKEGTRIAVRTTEAIRTVTDSGPNTLAPISLDDLDKDLVPMRVRVLDPDDQPVAHVRVRTGSPLVTGLTIEGVPTEGRSWGSGTTGPDGVTTFDLFATALPISSEGDVASFSVSGGTYTLFLTPPPRFEPVTLYDVVMTPSGAQVTIKLVLAQVVNPPPTTTTTTTTTTVAPTTTTTTVAPTTTTTTVAVTTTTAADGTSTTTAAPDDTTATTTGTAVAAEDELPKTGLPIDLPVLGFAALLALVLGALMVRASREEAGGGRIE